MTPNVPGERTQSHTPIAHTIRRGSISREHYHIALLAIGALILFSLPSVLRWDVYDNPSIIGFPTYLHHRTAAELLLGYDGYDELSFGGRPFTYPPLFALSIAAGGLLFSLSLAGVLVVAAFGALSVVFFYLIARRIVSHRFALLGTLLFMLLPGTIYFNAHLSSRAPPLALGMAALYFLMSPKRRIVVSGLLFGVAFLFHPETAGIFILIASYLALEDRRVLLSFVLAGVIAAAWYVPFFAQQGLPTTNSLYDAYKERQFSLEPSGIENILYELSPNAYITLAMAALALIGFFTSRHSFLPYWLLIFFALALIAERFAVYLIVPVALCAIEGIVFLLQKNKRRSITIIFVVAILLYATFFAAAKITFFAQAYPTSEQYDAFQWISTHTPIDSTVLADWPLGHWVSGIAHRRNFMDGYAEFAPNATGRLRALDQFFDDCTVPFGYNISYAYLEAWDIRDRNITCVDRFPVVYNQSGLLVYAIENASWV